MGQSRWKGKECEEEGDYAIVIPRIPGLVFFPRILPESLQRSLVVETLSHARAPNLTSLDPHYHLPTEGLWARWLARRGEETVRRKDGAAEKAEMDVSGSSTPCSEGVVAANVEYGTSQAVELDERGATVRDLISKLRWSNVGWHYNWTTKLYEFERGHVPLSPLIYRCCRDLARLTPWHLVYESVTADGDRETSATSSAGQMRDWRSWKDAYEPDAGIVNFYQLKDSLTSHIDFSEVDAVSPLVSLSLGHSSVFLVGGTTRDVPPLPILLHSGDGLIMSGEGRRVYHALPRVLEGTLPSYLLAPQPDPVEGAESWTPYGEYLERGARINVNVRSVF
ncbi:oxoglutarate/iron-dependent oxygenase [Rhodotorula toruloides]|uniref:Oxoglutarate/iron-dependent oxygenase n=1 Tax=Rhodotorula toruloides TaxID=5286 RepID=A0A511K8X3_RHOTO|nr:oxoglutarate/iron-dependent oxygenase [Rhodotorula toruloides]